MKTIIVSMFACIIFYSMLILIPYAMDVDPAAGGIIAAVITVGMVSMFDNLIQKTIDISNNL